MDINYNEFEILCYIERINSTISQRDIVEGTKLSLGTVNKTIKLLLDKKLITKDNLITSKGLEVLEPYRVRRIIFLAAGFGSRLMPITLNTPKPMVKVNGKRIIETQIDAAIKAGIPEIIIVTGYLGETFSLLKNKYPSIKLIHNNKYNECNNISSAYLVKDMLDNTYVCDSDLYLLNENIIRKYEYRSSYLGRHVDRTDDWCLKTRGGIIKDEVLGGIDCYLMYGIAYLDSKTGKKMSSDIEKAYNLPGGKEFFWEQVMLDKFNSNYQIYVRECEEEDIMEIDTFNELKSIDKAYDI